MSTPKLPNELMTGALLHFEHGVPIDDLALRIEQRRRMSRVDHVYWLWKRNPYLDPYQMFRQLVKGHYADLPSETHAARKDYQLFEFVKDRVSLFSRKDAQAKVLAAAEKTIRIGMETDNVNALTRGGRLLFQVAGLDKPEENGADISKVSFLPSVVVTNVKEVDPEKDNINDDEIRRITEKYGAYVDEKRTMVDNHVATMEARSAHIDDADQEVEEEHGWEE